MDDMSCAARAFCRASATTQRPSLALSALPSSDACFRRKPLNHATALRPQRPRTSTTNGTKVGPG
eukprot:9593818-Lingulodinium_polyedra.AAC.1